MYTITIRSAYITDAARIAEISSQPSVVWGTVQLPAQTPDRWRKRLEGNHPDTAYVLVAEIEGSVVGMLGLFRSTNPRTHHVGELGVVVDEQYHGGGVGTALMASALEAADKWLNLVRVELEVYPDNERAIRLYERFGFVQEGRKRLNAWRDGQYVDSLVMGRIRPGV
ncbi:MAG: GNAT family N-acetyltransferase [Mycobacterium leprae]